MPLSSKVDLPQQFKHVLRKHTHKQAGRDLCQWHEIWWLFQRLKRLVLVRSLLMENFAKQKSSQQNRPPQLRSRPPSKHSSFSHNDALRKSDGEMVVVVVVVNHFRVGCGRDLEKQFPSLAFSQFPQLSKQTHFARCFVRPAPPRQRTARKINCSQHDTARPPTV